jgi:hypothetical protein
MRSMTTGLITFAAALVVPLAPALAADITGAGATFPFPIYAKWAAAYKASTGIGMNYQSIGSGAGIAQIKAQTIDFGASDMPLKPDELKSAGLVQFPAIIGGVVPVMNVEGVARRGAVQRRAPYRRRSGGPGDNLWKPRGDRERVRKPRQQCRSVYGCRRSHCNRLACRRGWNRRVRRQRQRHRHRRRTSAQTHRTVLPRRSQPITCHGRDGTRAGNRQACAVAPPGRARHRKRTRQGKHVHRTVAGATCSTRRASEHGRNCSARST